MIRPAIYAAAACAALFAHSVTLGLVALAVIGADAALPVAMDVFRLCRDYVVRPLAAQISTLLLICLIFLTPAQAAVAAPVDIQPFLAQIIDLAILAIGPPLAALILGLAYRLFAWVGIKTSAAADAKLRATVEQGLDRAADFARAKVGAMGRVPVNLRSDALAHGVDFALDVIPDALKKLGIADKASKRLEAMVEARLGASPMGEAAAG